MSQRLNPSRSASPSPREVYLAVLDGIANQRWDELPAYYAEQTDVRHPFAADTMPPLTLREDIRRHFQWAAERLDGVVRFTVGNLIVHETTDPETIIVECTYDGHNLRTGMRFSAPNIFVVHIRDGLIDWSRDYTGHAQMMAAINGDGAA